MANKPHERPCGAKPRVGRMPPPDLFGSAPKSTATLDLRSCRMPVRPPIEKQKRYPTLSLTVIHAREHAAPEGRDRIEWKLLTDLDVDDVASVVEKLEWYAQRWKIDTFHKILKSGCNAERAKLRTADRLTNLLAIYCVVGWRVFWLTMVQRSSASAPAVEVFTDTEIDVLRKLRAPDHREHLDRSIVNSQIGRS